MTADTMRTLSDVTAVGPTSLRVRWSDGISADLDLDHLLRDTRFEDLAGEFDKVRVGEWGHSLTWPSGIELGAETLWLETLAATGHDDARFFLEWRLRNGLSVSKAAEALGVPHRRIASYSNAEKPIPKSILLACKGWEAVRSGGMNQAA